MKPIAIHGQPIAGGKLPLICAPLVGRTQKDLVSEAATVAIAKPDVVEWRADFYSGLRKPAEVIDTAKALKKALGATPLLFTKRSAKEGGEPADVGAKDVVALYQAVCDSACVDLVDFEMSNAAAEVREVLDAAKKSRTSVILSYHNFRETPSLAALSDTFARAQALGADVAKVAVMPRTPEDVLTLLSATHHASQTLAIPLISMSMGALGSLTRLFGWAFGSALTFGIGASGSAPGQVPIEDLNTVIALARKALGRA